MPVDLIDPRMHLSGSGSLLRKSVDAVSCGGDNSPSDTPSSSGGGGFSVILSRGASGGVLSADGSLQRYATHPRLVSIGSNNQQQQPRSDEGKTWSIVN